MRSDRRWHAWDAGLAAGLFSLGALQVAIEGSGWTILPGIAWMTLPVALRRVQPLAAVAISWLAVVVYEGFDRDITSQGYAAILGLVLTVYSVARHGRRWEQRAGLAVALICAWVSVLLRNPMDVPSLLLTTLIAGAPWSAGYVVQRSVAGRDQVAQDNQRLILERERHTQEAIAATRVDIAREMHDVLGHSLAVMVMQLGAADHVFEGDPARARAAIRSARSAGKEALSEVRSLVALYRDEDTAAANRPMPSVGDVRELVEDLSSSGLEVRLDMPGELPRLAPATSLAAYRIVQESLTNAIRHGSGDIAVSIRANGALQVRIDNAAHTAVGPFERGFGLIGMEERARSCGGSLEVKRSPGRFTIAAELPPEAS